MGGLNVRQFAELHHPMKSRGHSCVPTCHDCIFGGERCSHPERKKSVLLSEPNGWPIDGRYYFGNDHVCNAVAIPMPKHILVPELPPLHAVRTMVVGNHAAELHHGDPACPYIATIVLADEGRTEYLGQGVEIRDLKGYSRVPGRVCEIPKCKEMLGLPPGERDGHIRQYTRHDDGFVPYPAAPPLSFPDGDDPLTEFREGEITLIMGATGSISTNLTDEQAADMVRRVKLLVKGNRHIGWNTLLTVLRGLGLREVADRLDFDWRVEVLGETMCWDCYVYDHSSHPPIIRVDGRPACEKHHIYLASRLVNLPE